MSTRHALPWAVLLACASFATAAAEGGGTLRVEQGRVMASAGGEFLAAQTGLTLAPGDRIMLTEGAKASVLFDGNCRRDYAQPGVYVVARECSNAAPVAASASAVSGKAVAIVGGVVLAGVAIATLGGDDDDAPPVSR